MKEKRLTGNGLNNPVRINSGIIKTNDSTESISTYKLASDNESLSIKKANLKKFRVARISLLNIITPKNTKKLYISRLENLFCVLKIYHPKYKMLITTPF